MNGMKIKEKGNKKRKEIKEDGWKKGNKLLEKKESEGRKETKKERNNWIEWRKSGNEEKGMK